MSGEIFETIQPIDLESRIKGKYALLKVFKEICPPCQEIEATYHPVKEFADERGIILLGIPFDSLKDWLRGKRKADANFPTDFGCPALIFYKNGRLVSSIDPSKGEISGYVPPDALIPIIKDWYGF